MIGVDRAWVIQRESFKMGGLADWGGSFVGLASLYPS